MRHKLLISGMLILLGLRVTELQAQTVKDIEGSVYKTVKIGTQEWMAENLKTTKYNDGTAIPTEYSDEPWSGLTTGGYSFYPYSQTKGLNSDAEVIEAYGALYNWYAVATGKLCPTGWRVPTDEDWTALTDYAGEAAGSKLKSTRTSPDAHPRMESPNTGATDEYGFSALPGGYRLSNGNYTNVGYSGHWWSSSSDDTKLLTTFAWYRSMIFDSSSVNRYSNNKLFGFSVRCMKDLKEIPATAIITR